MDKKVIKINGVARTLIVDPESMLSDVLRKQLMLTGCKVGCGNGQCGACSILMDGKVTRACIRKMKTIPDLAEIETIEGIGTPEHLHPLQLAWMGHGCAQCGFCSPGFILSAKQLLAENIKPTRGEIRDWFQKHRNACRCTGYKPLVDAVMDAAKVLRGEMKREDLLYKPVGNNITGTYYHRPSALAKVTGTWDYGADVALQMPEETLHIALVQAEVSHANIKSIDKAAAEKMPGVYKVITHDDVIGNNRISGLITFATNKGDGWDRPILSDKKVFQYGDAIAMVAATTFEEAQAAAKAVKVELELLPTYMSAPEAMADDAIEIHPGVPNVYFEIHNKKGEDTQSLMDKAAYVSETSTYSSRQPHLPIEPDCGNAYIDGEGRLTIHSKSIGIHLHSAMIATGIGIEADKLRLVQNPAGGTFGYKFSPTMEALLGVACLACDNKPVTLVYNMYQQITYTGKRSPTFMNLKVGADEGGKIIAVEGDNFLDHGPYSEFGDLLTLRLAQYHFAGYDVPNIRSKNRAVCTNHAWGSAFRGYGAPEALLGSEIAMDELAHKMGIDPFELRYKNIYREGSTTITGSVPDVLSLEEMFDTLRPAYYEAKKRCAALNEKDSKYKHGVSVSLGIYGCGLDGVDASEAFVELLPNGDVLVGDSWEDHGQGADIGSMSIAHQTLKEIGITPEQIKLIKNDMAYTPNSGPAGGSRSNVVTGNAIRVASEKLIEAMKKDDGSVRTYDEMVADKRPLRFDGKWMADMCTDCDLETSQGDPFSTYMYELFMPEVKVDMATGKVEVVSFKTIVDVGTIMNRSVVDGQIYGGLAQGIGLALSENFEDLSKDTTLKDCGLPYIKDVPDNIDITYLETYRKNGPYGSSGVGEAPLTAPHPAILNAIFEATGVRLTQLPALPHKVKAGIDALNK